MASKLPVFLMLWMFAAGPIPGVGADATSPLSPQTLLGHAVRTLESHRAVSAQVRHEVDLFGKHLFGGGSYLEQRQGPDHLIRLELTLQLGAQTSSLVQVCDGRFLWTRCNLLGEVQLSRIDVARARRGLEQMENLGGKKKMEILPGLGGLPRLLRGLYASFDFSSVEAAHWGEQKQTVWRLRGRWKPDQLVKLLPDQQKAMQEGEPPDLSKLPPHLPDQVVLLLGQGDLFPHRIEYRRAAGKRISGPADPAGRLIVAMDLFQVVINSPQDPNRFFYNPGNLECSDRTDEFLESLGVKN
jgi:hypothetical protein